MTNDHHPPSFIHRGGDIIMHPTFQQKNTKLYGFFVEGNLNKLQACLDRDLNAAAAGKYHFKPLSNYVMLTFAGIEQLHSSAPEDINKGWGTENDVCFWIPVGNIIIKDGKEYLNDFYWYSPYIWVDSPIAMVNGRDLFGYPKTMGKIDIPNHQAPNTFSAAVNSFKTYSRETKAEWNPIVSINNLTPNEGPVEQWDDFIDAMVGIFDLADGAQLYRPDINAISEIINTLKKPELPQLFLKQMPDNSGDHAVYQAIVEAPAVVESFHGGGLLLGDYEITLHDVASVPITKDLGITVGIQQASFSFWMDFSFSLPKAKTLVNNSQIPPKQKIAILGGGVAACTSAFALTSQPGWENKYDITLYQKGWRLGGKGASGRNSQMGERIEEHGLHIWLGFYRNAFEYIQKAYEELDRPEGSTLRTWQDAFKPHDFVVFMEHYNGDWSPWSIDFPTTSGDPGIGTESVSTWKLLRTFYAYLKQWLGEFNDEMKLIENAERAAQRKTPQTFLDHISHLSEWVEDEVEDVIDDAEKLFKGFMGFIESLPDEFSEHSEAQQGFLRSMLQDIKQWIEEEFAEYLEEHTKLRRLYVLIDLGISVSIGVLRDDVINQGYDVINDIDFRDWLIKHGANQDLTANSSPVRALYDLIFAYEDGNIATPNAEAGTMLRGMFRLGLCYNGSIMWKMQAGMGDTIFTPYYQVLKNRGVKFKYFHEVDEIIVDPENPQTVKTIKINRQVDLIDGPGNYHPLVPVKGLACWPSNPIYEQIVPEQAQLLRQNNIDLESFWGQWPKVYQEHYGKPLPQISLEKGKDFDIVIHGMSIGGLPFHGKQLLDNSPALKACHANVKTVVTQAYQLWTTPSLIELDWQDYGDNNQQPIMTSWTEPVDTWAAMNQLIDKEDWRNFDCEPGNVAYFCGVQAITELPTRDDYDFPIRSKAAVKDSCLQQLQHEMYSLWPAAATAHSFDWQALMSPNNHRGIERFDDQYWRSNINPSERYVQSVVGSTQHRIDTKIKDFDNIYFTGDWIKTGINAGCVEAATMAGLQTSRAISGYPAAIKGEHDFGDPDL